MNTMFSLCLTTQKKNDNDRTILFRLADKTGNELQEPNYGITGHEERYPYPYTSSANHNIGELKIWEWNPSIREWAKKTSISFCELINNSEITSLTEKSILELLKKGLNIPNYFGQKSLLVIGEDEYNYKVIEMDLSIASTVNGVTKLSKNVMKINGYILSKNDFLCTEKVVVYSPDGEILPPRKVYKYLSLKEADFIIDTLTFEEKLELFINKEIKIRSFTRSQQKEMKNLFAELLYDYDAINEFFMENGFNRDGLIDEVNKVSNSINYVLSDNNLWDEFSKVMIDNIPELTDKFNLIVEARYLENNRAKLEELDLEILNIERRKKYLSGQCEEYEVNIGILKEKKIELEKNVKEIENTYSNLKIAFSDRVIEIKQNMAEFVSKITLLELLGIGVNRSVLDRENYFVKKANPIYSEVDSLYDTNEFIDVLTMNLKIAGIETESSAIVSKFIVGSIKQQNKIFLTGKYSSNVADAISATVCGMAADVISVTNSGIHLEKIIEQINTCGSKVVLIENIIGLNETVILQLLKMKFNKQIVFANDISETINFIPNSLLSRCNLLFLDYICEKILQEEFIYTDASNVKFENAYDKYTYTAVKEELGKLTNKCIYSNVHWASKSELITYIEDIGENDGIYSWLLCEAIPHQVLTNSKEVAEEIINIMQLSEKHTSKLQSLVR